MLKLTIHASAGFRTQKLQVVTDKQQIKPKGVADSEGQTGVSCLSAYMIYGNTQQALVFKLNERVQHVAPA